ncbi:hypothetical protein [Propionimicrobium sp. PCR01-08-3]|uniref:PKD domain-containing protein n=1 Tax=Propionimicrobium sp. PCR01-08-3 TaxID=3052086 RepID=UPI00255CBEDE|nr:hypothetical protein [Propionimicrobium sp. PCR01-08-3]WIY83178.1 hypothetical protein QQ658_02120 [Propionimicrobium sp. PCR01-08-3]
MADSGWSVVDGVAGGSGGGEDVPVVVCDLFSHVAAEGASGLKCPNGGRLLPGAAPAADVADAPVVDVGAVARSAVASLGVPAPRVRLSPEPQDNEWGALGVGLPIWGWVDDPGSLTQSASAEGIDISLTASRGTVRFDWGDGTVSECTQMSERPAGVDPLTPSPTCGHTYLKRGDYTITVTAEWSVAWSALGQQGEVPLVSNTVTYEMPIREFVTVVIG